METTTPIDIVVDLLLKLRSDNELLGSKIRATFSGDAGALILSYADDDDDGDGGGGSWGCLFDPDSCG